MKAKILFWLIQKLTKLHRDETVRIYNEYANAGKYTCIEMRIVEAK